MADTYPMYLAGEWVDSDDRLDITNPFNGDIVGRTFQASREQVDQAIRAAECVFPTMRTMPTFERVKLLTALAGKLKENRDLVARTIALEAGKPIRDAEVEADRGVFTVEVAAEEARRIEGEV